MSKIDGLNFKNMQILRERKNITQVKLSLMVGVSQQSITYYETNTRTPSLPVAIKIAKVLGTNVEGLMDGDNIIAKYYTLCDTDKETINKILKLFIIKIIMFSIIDNDKKINVYFCLSLLILIFS